MIDLNLIQKLTISPLRKCRNLKCNRLVIGHRCSGYCSIECLKECRNFNDKNNK